MTSRPWSLEKKSYCPDCWQQKERVSQTSLEGVTLGTQYGKSLGQKRCSPVTYLTMLGLPVSAIRVGQVAVLVPPAAMMRQGTVAEGDIIVSVKGCKLPSIVVSKSVPCRREDMRGESPSFIPEGVIKLWPERGLGAGKPPSMKTPGIQSVRPQGATLFSKSPR